MPSGLTHSGSKRASSLSLVENVCCIITGASCAVLAAGLVALVADGVADLVVDQVLAVGADVTLERHRTAHPARLVEEHPWLAVGLEGRVVAGRLDRDLVAAALPQRSSGWSATPGSRARPGDVASIRVNANCGLCVQLFGLASVWLTIRAKFSSPPNEVVSMPSSTSTV